MRSTHMTREFTTFVLFFILHKFQARPAAPLSPYPPSLPSFFSSCCCFVLLFSFWPLMTCLAPLSTHNMTLSPTLISLPSLF